MAGKTELYAPVPRPKATKSVKGKDGDDPPAPGSEFEPKPDDSEAVAQWRQRMGSDAAREIYKDRAATAECVNALAHNLMRMAALASQLTGWGTGAPAMIVKPA